MADKKDEKVNKDTKKKKAKAAKKTTMPKGKYIYAVGRRKTSTAKVRLYDGSGRVFINKTPLSEYIEWQPWQKELLQSLNLVGAEKDFDVVVDARGGGLHSQAQAAAHGISRALVEKDEGYKKVLKTNGMLTRDPRMKERKKPGLRKARRAPQWSKR